MRGNRWHRVVVAALAAALVAAGCSGDDDSGDDASPIVDLRGKAEGDEYPEVEVAAKDNEFIPERIWIDPGVTVAWANEGRSAHDIKRADSRVDFGDEFGVSAGGFGPDGTYEFRFDEPGVYRYFCSLHGSETKGMIGTVVVGDVDPESGEPAESDGGTVGGTLHVPDDYPTIQEAVDAAKPGSLVLVAPGVYKEAVTVTTENLVIRGLDRNETVLDGEFTRDNGFKVLADGVAIENITAQNFTLNGFFWTGVTGYRGSYLNAYRNGDYGIYAFDATKGQFDHSYAAGSPDAGYYIGQCYPCDAVITDVIAEWNGLGYSGTNAGGNLLIVNSVWHDNRAGIVPNSGTGEANPPERETTIVGNEVYSNNNVETPAISIAQTALGNGILIAGGNDNVVERNTVYDHDIAGIAVIPLPEKVLDPDDPKAINFDASGNVVRANVVSDSRAADLVVVSTLDDASDAGGNCFSDNTFTTSIPPDVESLIECGVEQSSAFVADLAKFVELLGGEKPGAPDYKDAKVPPMPDQPNMPDAATAPARPANEGVPMSIDLEAIEAP